MKVIFVFLLLIFIGQLRAQPASGDMRLVEIERAVQAKKLKPALSLASGNFTVHYYKCEWKVNPAKNYIQGRVSVHFIITAAASELTFDFSHYLKVDSVLMRRKNLNFSQQTNETLVIHLPKILSTGASDSLTIVYEGSPITTSGSFVQSQHNGTPVVWTLSEPYGAKDWWPCRNGLDDKADSIDIYITHPSKYRAASNGVLQSVVTNRRNTTAFYKHRYPIASYLVAFAVTNYSVFSDTFQTANGSLPVISYVYPEDSAAFRSSAYRILNALQFYSKKFTTYPFQKERYGQTQFGYGGGMEHQTNSFVADPGENLMAHELAHQWFGDKVTCGNWQDVWLNEGFATYCADFLYAEQFSHDQYKLNLQNDLADIVSQPGGSVKVDDTTNVGRVFDGRLTYHKGAFLLRMLRWSVGDHLFFKSMRSYLSDPLLKYNFARTADLQRNFESVTGLDLSYFFDQWFSGQGYPSFTVEWSEDANNKATITLSQTTSVPASVNFFRVPLELVFKQGNQQKAVVIDFKQNNQIVAADIGFKADTVLVDPDQYLISKNNKSIQAKTVSAANVKVSPNPFDQNIMITFKEPLGQKILFTLFDNFGHSVSQQETVSTGSYQTYQLMLPSTLSAGTYTLVVSVNGTIISRHLLKK